MSRSRLRYYAAVTDHLTEWELPVKNVSQAGISLVLKPDAEDDDMVSDIWVNERRVLCSPAQFQEVAKLFAALRCRVAGLVIDGLTFSRSEPAMALFDGDRGLVKVVNNQGGGLQLQRQVARFRRTTENVPLHDIRRAQVRIDVDPETHAIATEMIIESAGNKFTNLSEMSGGISILAHLATIYYQR